MSDVTDDKTFTQVLTLLYKAALTPELRGPPLGRIHQPLLAGQLKPAQPRDARARRPTQSEPANDSDSVAPPTNPSGGGAPTRAAWTDKDGTLQQRVIDFRTGPINEAGVNNPDARVLLAIVADRLRELPAGPFASCLRRWPDAHRDAQNWLNHAAPWSACAGAWKAPTVNVAGLGWRSVARLANVPTLCPAGDDRAHGSYFDFENISRSFHILPAIRARRER